MSFTDLLTISMPVYERKEFFTYALESALNQTVKCKIIVIDNCSSHNYFEKVCKEKNIPYYRNERNIGMAGNFAKGYELADTKYVMNLQDDDLLSPEYVESFMKAVNLHPDIDVFFSDFLMVTNRGELPHHHILPFGYMGNGIEVIEYGIKFKLGFPYMTCAIKRQKAFNVVDMTNSIGSYDWEWIYSNADKFSFYGESKKLYKYRVHNNQDTKKGKLNYYMSLPYIYDKVLKEKVSDTKLKKLASRNAFWELILLKSMTDDNALKNILKGNSKYENYISVKLIESRMLKIIFIIPRGIVDFTYRSLRKIGLTA